MKHLISVIVWALFASAVCFGQQEEVPLMDSEVRPMFYGGPASDFAIWVNARLQYPKAAKRKGIEGRVTLQFVIKKDGSMSDVRVVKGIDKSLDREAVRVVSSSGGKIRQIRRRKQKIKNFTFKAGWFAVKRWKPVKGIAKFFYERSIFCQSAFGYLEKDVVQIVGHQLSAFFL